ncbi:hypothetical protein X798_03730 [Onchocerca flexuosa]|uniref:Uncharacterized protein n=1 Tax=Onchocerca flexuosa TaxID=387005 RepID=A0A238BW99_9BILA|nr:hypothetical protein X798_03730 [Onchocerca flexuosa]
MYTYILWVGSSNVQSSSCSSKWLKSGEGAACITVYTIGTVDNKRCTSEEKPHQVGVSVRGCVTG